MTDQQRNRMRGWLFGGLLLLTGCAATEPRATTLYQDLGEQAGLERLADAFISRLAEDELVVDTFADTDIEAFRGHLIDQFCSLSGGGCEYRGRDMREAHAGMQVKPRQFNALVEDLMQAMVDVGIPLGARNRLLGLLAPMYSDIVSDSGPTGR